MKKIKSIIGKVSASDAMILSGLAMIGGGISMIDVPFSIAAVGCLLLLLGIRKG